MSTGSTSQQPSNAWKTEDRVIVITDEIPAGLREELGRRLLVRGRGAGRIDHDAHP